jgi:hypothetical protein
MAIVKIQHVVVIAASIAFSVHIMQLIRGATDIQNPLAATE